MAKFNRKTAKLCVVAMLSLVIGITAIIYDNNRIVIIRQEVNITDLPKSFEGFTILQISDLHGKRFGRHQERLAAINNSRYDMIAVTGDIMFGESYDPQPFYELLSGIKNKQWLFYAQGNTDEIAYDNRSLKTMPYGEELIKRGCKLVNRAYEIKRGQDTLWISPLDSLHFVDIKLKRLEQKMSNTSPSSGSRQAMIENGGT